MLNKTALPREELEFIEALVLRFLRLDVLAHRRRIPPIVETL